MLYRFHVEDELFVFVKMSAYLVQELIDLFVRFIANQIVFSVFDESLFDNRRQSVSDRHCIRTPLIDQFVDQWLNFVQRLLWNVV